MPSACFSPSSCGTTPHQDKCWCLLEECTLRGHWPGLDPALHLIKVRAATAGAHRGVWLGTMNSDWHSKTILAHALASTRGTIWYLLFQWCSSVSWRCWFWDGVHHTFRVHETSPDPNCRASARVQWRPQLVPIKWWFPLSIEALKMALGLPSPAPPPTKVIFATTSGSDTCSLQIQLSHKCYWTHIDCTVMLLCKDTPT